ncbi:MAG: hypothetical protein IJT91_06425 [Clostridia bacterium]|nr:hypothetical protein [Clostridia bacterium]
MKKSVRLISAILVLCIILPMSVIAYPTYVEQNPQIALPNGSPVIDGDIEATGIWSSPASFDQATAGHFWADKAMTSSGDIYFAYDSSYLYFAGNITDNNSSNDFVYSTGYDNIDNSGSSKPYGFNGDTAILMLDPLGIFEKKSNATTTWYCVGLFANNVVKVYRSQANEGDITSSVVCAGKRTSDGWRFEVAIPWSTVVSDAKKLYSSASVTAAKLSAINAVSRASFMYMDRYTSGGKTATWGRFITVCETTYDGYSGIATNGIVPKSYGLSLKNSTAPSHIWSDWTVVTAGTCTTGTVYRRECSDCGAVETKTDSPSGHSFGEWVITKAATQTTEGSRQRTCSACGHTETAVIPALGNYDPMMVVYFNASQSYVSEFTHIDVLNYHPASVDKAAGNKNAITHNYTSNLASVKRAARAQNPNIKFVFTVASNNLSVFESWLTSAEYADNLSAQIVDIIKTNDFDGIDIDYEFPTESFRQSQSFVYLIAKLRYDLDNLTSTTGKHYIVSVAVPATIWAFSLFDIEGLSNYVDYFNIMNYDLFINSPYTHHHASPYDNALPGLTGGSVSSDIQLYLANGIPASKIVVGCGMYAHTWTDVSGSTNGLYGTGTLHDSNYHYTDLLNNYINKGGFVRYWDDSAKAPYIYNSKTKVFASYDDEESVGYKCDLVNQYDVRGLMIFDYCTCDGIGFFDRIYTRLNSQQTHTHSYSLSSHTDATCTSAGTRVYVCSGCGDTYTETVPALGHDYASVMTAPTCVNDGYTTYTCSRCGNSYTGNITGALGHEYQCVEVVDPTCTEEGYSLHRCSRCGDTFEAGGTDPLGHDFGQWQDHPNDSTKEIRYCSRCDAAETRDKEIIINDDIVIEKISGYDIKLTGLDSTQSYVIRYATGEYANASAVKKGLNAGFVQVSGVTEAIITLPTHGLHTISAQIGSEQKFIGTVTIEQSDIEAQFKVLTNDLTVTVENLTGANRVNLIQNGNIVKKINASSFTTDGLKTWVVFETPAAGEYTIRILYADGATVEATVNVTVPAASVSTNGRVFTLTNYGANNVSYMRLAKGVITTNAEMKAASDLRTYGRKYFTGDMAAFAALDAVNGETTTYTVQIGYVSGYSEFITFDITPTVPVITTTSDSITLSNVQTSSYYLDWVRCAPGELGSLYAIRHAKGSQVKKTEQIVDGTITFTGLSAGKYTLYYLYDGWNLSEGMVTVEVK